jgi:methionine-rich copper-binding protein CopC
VSAALAPGAYVIQWRAVGADTHIVSGEIGFVVEG